MPLIVFEGIDGCGKTTQFAALRERLDRLGRRYHHFREPGGTQLGERVRALLLDPATRAGARAEIFGYQMARAQLVEEHLKPLLARGELVVLDRFYHSTLAYQARALGIDPARTRAAIELAVDGLRPDLVLYVRVPVAECLARQQRAGVIGDRIEARGQAYLERVAAGYEVLVREDGLIAIDGTAAAAEIAEQVWELVRPLV